MSGWQKRELRLLPSMSLRMTLPENVEKDKISAKVEHGILSIEIPKVKEEEKQKTSKAIEVK